MVILFSLKLTIALITLTITILEMKKPVKSIKIETDVWEQLKHLQTKFTRRFDQKTFNSVIEYKKAVSLSSFLKELIEVYKIIQEVKEKYKLSASEIELAKDMAKVYEDYLAKRYIIKKGGL